MLTHAIFEYYVYIMGLVMNQKLSYDIKYVKIEVNEVAWIYSLILTFSNNIIISNPLTRKCTIRKDLSVSYWI